MRLFIIVLVAVVSFSLPAAAQQPDTTSYAAPDTTSYTAPETTRPETPPPAVKAPAASRVYVGGSLGFNFSGDYSRFSITPLIGYRITKMLSIGAKFVYEYISDKRYTNDFTSSNYGGSVFARLRPTSRFYFHGEYAYMSYEYRTSNISSERDWVPFLLLGVGYYQPISRKASFFAEVLFDVLQDSKSPYDDWEPWINVGVTAGI